MPAQSTLPPQRPASTVVGHILAMPSHWLSSYEEFITKNASQVSQIESALRSLTYIIPGRFRDAEIASESIHSGVQLLSLLHDRVLARAASKLPKPPPHTAHARYTRFWAHKSALYRRVATALQMVTYTELLCEMVAAKRSGGGRGDDQARWRVVVLLEAIKALCRLLLLRVTRSRQLVAPPLPERAPIPDDDDDDPEQEAAAASESEFALDDGNNIITETEDDSPPPHGREWSMPRTGMRMPCLPDSSSSSDISAYLVSRVLTADDIRPATQLLPPLRGRLAHAAEVLHILAPLVYAVALLRSGKKNKRAWTPWVVGLAVEYAARQLRQGGSGLRATPLEREEWTRRGWAMAWWTMRGPFYDNVTRGVVRGVAARMPAFIGGIVEDYDYLWENYYFATSA